MRQSLKSNVSQRKKPKQTTETKCDGILMVKTTRLAGKKIANYVNVFCRIERRNLRLNVTVKKV